MGLTPFTGTVTIATLRANFDDTTAQLSTNANTSLVGKDFELLFGPFAALTQNTDLSLRSLAFTPTDDWQLRALAGDGTADASGRTLTVALTVDNGDATWLLDKAISGSTTSGGAGNIVVRQTYLTTATAVWLLKDVRYRLAVSCDAGSFTTISASVQLRSFRRRA